MGGGESRYAQSVIFNCLGTSSCLNSINNSPLPPECPLTNKSSPPDVNATVVCILTPAFNLSDNQFGVLFVCLLGRPSNSHLTSEGISLVAFETSSLKMGFMNQ